ncbi:MAG: hypothetical protein B7Z39_01550 [Novosphingobium sp. 12-64-8]|nr:MAG: hypothetical protein B7Z39_01550 [Novosphingobium sp. 12-64-8]
MGQVLLVFLAYAAFILMAALPVAVPVLAVAFTAWGAMLVLRGKLVLGLLCLALAGYLAAIIFAPAGNIPGAREYHRLRKINQQRAMGLRLMRSGTFGGTGKPVTVGEIAEAYGEPADKAKPGPGTATPSGSPTPPPNGDEPMVDPTPMD